MDNAHGTWQFSTDGGTTWTEFTFTRQSFPANVNLADLNGSDGLTLTGLNAEDWAGWAVDGLGDINGDGLSDVLIGVPRADVNNTDPDSNEGFAYVGFWNPDRHPNPQFRDPERQQRFYLNRR